MKRMHIFTRDLLAVLVVLGVAFAAGYFFCAFSEGEKAGTVAVEEDGFDLELPFEVERRVVTVEEVEARLFEIGELSTYAGEYTCTLGKDETRYLLDSIPVFGTTNSITISCNGIVKVGYDLSDITVRVGDDKIYISVPQAHLNDNYVIWDSLVCKESNNILNPIEFSQYQELIGEIEQMGLDQVTDQGIYKKAEDNLKALISVFLSEFDEYMIVFM